MDRGALVAAMSFSLPIGGWIPKGREAEDGKVPAGFRALREMTEGGYRARTEANVRDSDATLILADGMPLSGGTAYTLLCAERLGKPHLVVDLRADSAQSQVYDWMRRIDSLPGKEGDRVRLNVAGPRESRSPGIFEKTRTLLGKVLWAFRNYSGGDIVQVDENGEIGGWIDAEFVSEVFDVKANVANARGNR